MKPLLLYDYIGISPLNDTNIIGTIMTFISFTDINWKGKTDDIFFIYGAAIQMMGGYE